MNEQIPFVKNTNAVTDRLRQLLLICNPAVFAVDATDWNKKWNDPQYIVYTNTDIFII